MSTGPRIEENGRIGRYALLEHLGKGGMAVVYRATDTATGSIVAVKIFQSGPERTPEVSVKLRDREVRMLQSVQHPNIVKFRDSGDDGDCYFFAMEFVENSLLKCMRRGVPFELTDRVLILRQTASALAAIHNQGIVHRDIKPGNILLDQDPASSVHAKLTDLGIAKNVSETDIVREQMPTRVPGTPKYLSPEQIRLQAVDGRADIFSLGVVAYELLAGTTPFRAETTEGYLKANAEQTHVPVKEVDGDLPGFLSDMVDRMLVKDREERYDSDTLARDLEVAQQHLVSGAPLIERTNPASMFYKAPVRRVPPAQAAGSAIAPVSWALAGAFLLVGLVTTIAFWPNGPPAPGPFNTAPPAADAGALLQQAQAALPAGQNWRALAAIRRLGKFDLDPEGTAEAGRLAEQAQGAIAEPYRAAVARMLREDREDEARIAVRRMEDFMPLFPATDALTDALRQREALPQDEDGWQAALRETHTLVRNRRYTQALRERRALLTGAGADTQRVASVRRAIGDLFDHWGRYLQSGYLDPASVEEYFRVLDESADLMDEGPATALLGDLRLKLARIYRDKGMHDEALAHYASAASSTVPAVAEEAKQARDELVQWLASRPHDAATFAGILERDGFASSAWGTESEGRATQRIADGVLVLDVLAAPDGGAARRQTAQPVRNLGFTYAVQFRPSPSMTTRPGGARLGVAVISKGKDAFELTFDGASYVATVRRGSARSAAAGTPLQAAVGDESRTWHALTLAYEYDTGQLAVLLDGQELRRYAVSLDDVRLCVFLEADAGVAAQASFRNVSFRPPGTPPQPTP